MTQRGEQFGEGPLACPFIALELDRDRRSDKPDYRHRCFAEPTPQPRAIAHQEQYCLSADFAACPIFQGWAMRAAARPVPLPQANEGRARAAQPPIDQPPRASVQPPLPLDVPPVVPPPGEAWPSEAFARPAAANAPSQLSAFDAAADKVSSEPTNVLPDEAEDELDELDEPQDELDEPPVPDFLAGRPERPASQRPRASQPEVPFKETVRREDLIPSWDLTGRYGAHVSERRGGRGGGADDDGGAGSRLSGTVTTVAVIAILALGVLGVIFLPGLLAGKGPAATPSPTLSTALPTSLLSPSLPLSSGTPLVTAVPSAGITPSPEASPRLYTIKSTDNSLTQIAHRFHITLRQLLDANPQITNPDRIQVGQVIVIPNPTPTPTPLST